MVDRPLDPWTLPREAEAWPRVTDVIKSTLAAPELVEFSYYQAIDIVAGLVSHLVEQQDGSGVYLNDGQLILDVLTDADWIREVLVENKMTARDILNGLADEGKEGHDFLESLALAQLQVDEDRAYTMAIQAARGEPGHKSAIGNWWLMRQPTVLATERQVWSNRFTYRGTLDLYWKTPPGKRVLTDLKNRKANKPCFVNHKTPEAAAACHEIGAYISDHVQTGAYKIALEERIGPKVDERRVLVARKDGTWGEYTSDHIEAETFLSLLDVYEKLRGR